MRLPALLAVLAMALAGCVTTSTSPLALPGAHAPLAGALLDCALGAAERGVNASWAQDCSTRASHTAGPKEEIWLAVNPKDANNVVIGAKDLNPESSNHCVWNGVSVTHDGGKTWKDVVIGGKLSARQPTDPWFGYACNTDPMLQFTSNGDVHYGIELYNFLGRDGFGQFGGTPLQGDNPFLTPGWKILLATSHDGGDTWPDVITWMPDTGPLVDDYSRMTVVPTTQTILECINLAPDFGNVLSSRDNGKTGDLPVEVQGGCAAIAASPKGTVVLAGDGWWTSADDGKTFARVGDGFTYKGIPGQFEESKYRTGTNFEVAYDLAPGPGEGTLYCIYGASDRDEADVFVRSSADDGKTWSDAVRVNDDAAGSHQFEPNLVVAKDHSLHAFFMDKRYTPEHKLIDITHAVSLDGGKTWRNERVTTTSFDGDLGVHQRGFPFIGDYIGTGTSGDTVWGAWPDASDGKTTVVSAAKVRLAQP